MNRGLDEGLGTAARAGARRLLKLGEVLGMFWKTPTSESWPPAILALAEAREQARKSKNWTEADRLRGQLLEQGVIVEDGPSGPRLKRR